MKHYNITALGEILIDYTPLPKSSTGMSVFEQNPGGAPANVLACAAKLGCTTAFLGKVGKDTQGDFLRSVVETAGIESKGLISDKNYFTTLAFVSLSDEGERTFAFARKPGADTMLTTEELDLSILESTEIFHFGTLSLTHSPSREATIHAIEHSKKNGAIISFDPNYRAPLWENMEAAQEQIQSVLHYTDILKISDEECFMTTGEEDPRKAMDILLKQVPVVSITLGAKGALFGNQEGVLEVAGFKPCEVVDTTGAGDSFWGAVLTKLTNLQKKPQELSLDELKEIGLFANATASYCVGRRGAIPSMPSMAEVDCILNP